LSVVSVVCLSGRGLCDGPITRPEESYRLCCVWSRNLKNEEAKTRKWVVKARRRRRRMAWYSSLRYCIISLC
jgi:hypothetical protein